MVYLFLVIAWFWQARQQKLPAVSRRDTPRQSQECFLHGILAWHPCTASLHASCLCVCLVLLPEHLGLSLCRSGSSITSATLKQLKRGMAMTSKGHADTLLESLTKGTPSSGVQFSKVSFALPKGRGYSWVRLLEDDRASTQHVYRSWVKFPVQNRSWALYKSFVFPRYTKTVRCVMICPRFLYWGHFWFPPEELYKIAESFCSRPNCWKILDVASPKETMLQEIMMWLTFLYYTHCICIYKYREQHV